MTTIHDAYINALLADASYVDGLRNETLEADLTGRMTPELAKYIGDNFTVVTQVGGLASSFEATVWRDNSGQIYVSMRGTQEGPDFSADADLVTSGLAHQQLADMVNWWLRATTPPSTATGDPQYAPQIALNEFNDFVEGSWVRGTGELAEVAAIKSVNGHSLGGYLATAFARLFGQGWPIEGVNTFNSAGFSRPATSNIEDGFNQIAQLIRPALGLGAFSAPQNNYFASNGINVTTNTWDPVGFTQYGTRIGIFQEDGVTLSELGFSNHFMYKLSDVLALGDALERLDPSMDLARLSGLVSAGSSQMAASYESVLDALRKVFLGGDVIPTMVGDANEDNAGPQPDARLDYHANLKNLTDSAAFQAAVATHALTISSLVGMSSAELATRAQAANGLAYRYALRELNPFAVLGPDSLYDGSGSIPSHNSNGELNLYDVTKDAGLSDRWLQDRAALLGAVIKYNTDDRNDQVAPGDTNYFDAERQLTLRAFAAIKGIGFAKAGEQLSGLLLAPDADLFGTSGDDTILGAPNKNYVEGGAGNDTITTFGGKDEIHGGDGEDRIKGGDGENLIIGGKSNDSELRGGSDKDIIWGDEDQTSARYFEANYGGNDFLYGEGGSDFLYGGGGSDRLDGGNGVDQLFGDGMDLDDADRTGSDTLIGGAGADFLYGGGGRDFLYGDAEATDDRSGNLTDGDTIFGNAGDDDIYAGMGADTVEGGDNNDLIVGGGSSDVRLAGGKGEDRIYGDAQAEDDLSYAFGGNDRLFGDEDADKLYGGAGNDELVGGKGDDRLEGGADFDTYTYTTGDGSDTIFDSGHKGRIRFDSTTLAGGKRVAGQSYYETNNFRYSLAGATLTVKKRKRSTARASKMAKENDDMATTTGSADVKTEKGVGVRLVPTGDADLPILANFARVNVSPGVLVDFGFLDPAALNALARTARAGGKMPDAVNGRLAGRFALTPDSLMALHQQLGRAIASLQTGRKPADGAKKN